MTEKTVLVTGATGVIGNAIARALHAENFPVRAHYFSQPGLAASLSGISIHQADLRDRNQVRKLFEEISPIDAVIHTAAVAHDALVARTSITQWQETIQLNLSGTFYVLQNALNYLPDGGRVVLLGSRVGEHGNAGQAAYSASKAGVIALAQTAAKEGAGRQIAVNVLCPPFVPSAMSEFPDTQRESQMLFKNKNPQDALSAICSMVLWLLSEEAKTVSGQVLHPDQRIGFGTASGFL